MGRGGAREGGVGEVQAGGPAHHHESILGVWQIKKSLQAWMMWQKWQDGSAGMDVVRGMIKANKASPNQIIGSCIVSFERRGREEVVPGHIALVEDEKEKEEQMEQVSRMVAILIIC